jgi:hypothetical protein
MRDGKPKPSPASAEAPAAASHSTGIVPGSAHIEAERAQLPAKKRGTTGPAIAELIAVERKAGRDLAWIVAASVGATSRGSSPRRWSSVRSRFRSSSWIACSICPMR